MICLSSTGSLPASCRDIIRWASTVPTATAKVRQWRAGMYTNRWQCIFTTCGTDPSSGPNT